MTHDRERIGRNDRREIGRNLRLSDRKNVQAYTITQEDWQQLSSGAFREHVGPSPGGAKRLASDCACNEKTAQNWLDGKTTPHGILDLRAMHSVPAYAALKREIAAMESDLDPRLQAKYRELYLLTMSLSEGAK